MQWYVNVPAVGNVSVNVCPAGRSPESNDIAVPESLVTVCVVGPLLVHVTESPALIVIGFGAYEFGLNESSVIVTPLVAACDRVGDETPNVATSIATAIVAIPAQNNERWRMKCVIRIDASLRLSLLPAGMHRIRAGAASGLFAALLLPDCAPRASDLAGTSRAHPAVGLEA